MTKIEVIDTAFKVWGRNFYRKTSLSQLALELGVSKPALYRHFENKQALLEAMTERFLDDFACSIKPDFENALKNKDADEGISTILRSLTGFFAKNVYALIFSLINIYERKLSGKDISERLKTRGADLAGFNLVIDKKYESDPSLVRLIFATLTFFMSSFHKMCNSMEDPLSLSDEDVKSITSKICNISKHGLGYSPEKSSIDFDELENKIYAKPLDTELDPFFKAVAQAVAEAGPWDVSMDMVAKRLGLSKSSLYGHFKNRKDMLRRLFVTEFKKIIEFARQGINLSANTAEQLYLGIFSISVYLRSRPEILVAMDWIRTRKLDFGKPDKNLEIYRLFEDVNIEPLKKATEDEKQQMSHWILFLLINILIRQIETNPEEKTDEKSVMQNNNIRFLYIFLTQGLGGFVR
ncbi:MAG: TetR/AcrR family transcriptional regulator [Treponema sp.]|nr:TetR/AcrR family transcriptional regulator [Treponema sp.]